MTERSRRVARLAALVAICSASVIAARSALAAGLRSPDGPVIRT